MIHEYKKTGGLLVSKQVPTESAMLPNSLLAKSFHQTVLRGSATGTRAD